MGELRRSDRFRMWIAGGVFWLAGRIHRSYDVYLDYAEPRGIPDDVRAQWLKQIGAAVRNKDET